MSTIFIRRGTINLTRPQNFEDDEEEENVMLVRWTLTNMKFIGGKSGVENILANMVGPSQTKVQGVLLQTWSKLSIGSLTYRNYVAAWLSVGPIH